MSKCRSKVGFYRNKRNYLQHWRRTGVVSDLFLLFALVLPGLTLSLEVIVYLVKVTLVQICDDLFLVWRHHLKRRINTVRTRSHQPSASTSTQSQRCNDACNIALIKKMDGNLILEWLYLFPLISMRAMSQASSQRWGPVYTKRQRQRCDDARDTSLIDHASKTISNLLVKFKQTSSLF